MSRAQQVAGRRGMTSGHTWSGHVKHAGVSATSPLLGERHVLLRADKVLLHVASRCQLAVGSVLAVRLIAVGN